MPHLPYDVYALHELNTEVGVLTARNEQIEIRIGTAGTPIEAFFLSAKDIDEIILPEIDKINAIKKEIIKISAEAFNAVAGITSVGILDPERPNVPPFDEDGYAGRIPDPSKKVGTDWYLAETSDNLSSYNNYNFILNGTAETVGEITQGNTGPVLPPEDEQFYRGAVGVLTSYFQCNGETPDPYILPITCPGGTLTEVENYIDILTPISRAPVYPDKLRAWQFPELEKGFGASGNAGTADLNPTYPGEYQTITDQLDNAGIGRTSNLFFNGEYNGVFSAVPMGYFYDIVGVNTLPVYERTDNSNALVEQFSNKISALEAQINVIRTYITEVANGATAVKEQKHGKQLTKWGLEWSYNENERRIALDNDAIEVIEAKEE